MDTDQLSKYEDLLAEKKDIEERIAICEKQLIDLEQGTNSMKLQKKIKITKEYLLLLNNSIAHIKAEIVDIQSFIEGITDTRIKKIIKYRYCDSLSWIAVAFSMGGVHTAEGCRKAVQRYFSTITDNTNL